MFPIIQVKELDRLYSNSLCRLRLCICYLIDITPDCPQKVAIFITLTIDIITFYIIEQLGLHLCTTDILEIVVYFTAAG